ncbi:MAG: hypothetical protein OEU92_22960 [Alphaproteobacteria bacterium]|nr:hypothetical protein [Alphaproteobacteria bacterium]
MPGSTTAPDRQSACDNALFHVAFRYQQSVGVRKYATFTVQWLAYVIPYRRFADILTNACARLGANVDRYSFITVDSHHLLLASLLAHADHGTDPRLRSVENGPFTW